jgi:hypothetical protein
LKGFSALLDERGHGGFFFCVLGHSAKEAADAFCSQVKTTTNGHICANLPGGNGLALH